MHKPILHIKNIYYLHILNNLSLQVNNGDFLVLLGANGSGKSSLFKLITRHATPIKGSIELCGSKQQDYTSKAYSKRVVSIGQHPDLQLCLSMTIYEHMHLYTNTLRSSQHSKICTTTDSMLAYLQQFNTKFPKYLHQPVKFLSGGEKQMLVLALQLLHQPDILLLDEHTSALDPSTSRDIMQMTHKIVKQRGITCILTTHDLSIAMQYGNRLVALQGGAITQDFNATQKAGLTALDVLDLCYAA